MSAGQLRFVHISDLHILAEAGRRQFGVDTGEILARAVPMIQELVPDFVIASGDLAGDESEDAYRRLQRLLEPLGIPVHFLMGNHDDRPAFRRVFRPQEAASTQPVTESFEHEGHRFLLLDSSQPGMVEGALGGEQMAWLEAQLSGRPDLPTWIFLHHQPLPIHIRWLDALGLTNGETFLALLARYRQVGVVAFGHVHQARRWRYRGTLFLAVPALAFQFSSVRQDLEVTQESPGFRLLEVADGVRRSSLHYLDGQVEAEPSDLAIPIYVR